MPALLPESATNPVRHLYAHIPFCPQKCAYCAFVTHVGSLKLMEPYLDALRTEAGRLRDRHPGGPLDTVYLGGGTPSLMTPQQVQRFLQQIDLLFGIAPGAEVTLEAHPSTVTEESLFDYRGAGVTRLSFGGESIHPAELHDMGRGHSGERVITCLSLAQRSGFGSVAVDLIYGLPHQTVASWRASLASVLTAAPDHLSLYSLQLEPGTVFARRRRDHQLQLPDDDLVVSMYHEACEVLRAAGYDHYEVANWARPGHRCRHNLAYWHNREWYAVGVGAHGHLGGRRTENMRQTRPYIDRLQSGGSPVQRNEWLDDVTRRSDDLMLQFRLLDEGVPRAAFRSSGRASERCFEDELDALQTAQLVRTSGDRVLLTELGVPVANEVWDRLSNHVM